MIAGIYLKQKGHPERDGLCALCTYNALEAGEMALYSRDVPQHRRAAEKVRRLISTYSSGVTFEELMRDNKEEISDRSSVIASIHLLLEKRLIFETEPWEGKGFLTRVRLSAQPLVNRSSVNSD